MLMVFRFRNVMRVHILCSGAQERASYMRADMSLMPCLANDTCGTGWVGWAWRKATLPASLMVLVVPECSAHCVLLS